MVIDHLHFFFHFSLFYEYLVKMLQYNEDVHKLWSKKNVLFETLYGMLDYESTHLIHNQDTVIVE